MSYLKDILPILSSALSKEENVETPGDQEPYDPGERRGSNYKTPMERFKSIKTASPGFSHSVKGNNDHARDDGTLQLV